MCTDCTDSSNCRAVSLRVCIACLVTYSARDACSTDRYTVSQKVQNRIDSFGFSGMQFMEVSIVTNNQRKL
jgi:hypothetical protein